MNEAISATNDELNLISTELVDNVEFEKVKNKIEANMIYSSSSVLNKSYELGLL